MTAEDGPARTNLTDADATLQKARNGGFVVGYNAQAMVAGLVAAVRTTRWRRAGC